MRNTDKLTALNEFLSSGLEPPGDLADWLHQAVARWQSGHDLATAFGIFDSASERRYRRNQALLRYADLLDGSLGKKARDIAGEAKRIHQGRNGSPLLEEIDGIFPIPESCRQIRSILMKCEI